MTPEKGAAAPSPNQHGAIRRDKKQDFALVGQVIADKYKVLEVLGQGGFGSVYLVEITAGMVGERLALKLLPAGLSQSKTLRDQFLNEIRVAMKMVDKYIVQIRDVGVTEDGLLYYTMDYCPGVTLREVMKKEGKVPIPRVLMIVRRVLRALQTAHSTGIIHRDLKPANIMVQQSAQAGRESVRVLDFGIATAIQGQSTTPQEPRQKGFAGSPYYMPPEQFMNQDMGFYTDTYALGVILYECVTGQKPYGGATPQEVFKNLKKGEIAPPETLTPEVENYPGLSELIMKSIQRNPDRRFQTSKELFEAVSDVFAGKATTEPETAAAPPSSRPPSRAQRRPPAGRRSTTRMRQRRPTKQKAEHGSAIAFGALLLIAVVLGVVFQKEVRSWFSGDKIAVEAEDSATPETKGETTEASKKRVTKRDGDGPEPKASSLAEQRENAEAKRSAWLKENVAKVHRAGSAKNWAEVVENATAVLEQEPNHLEALRWLGIASFHQGNFDRSDELLSKAQSLATANELEIDDLRMLALARLEAKPPRLEDAAEAAKLAWRRKATDPESVLLLAQILDRLGEQAKLRKILQAAKKGKVTSKELEKLYQRVVVDGPRKAKIESERLLIEAKQALDAGKYQEAIDLATRSAGRQASGEAELLTIEGRLGLGEAKAALKLLEQFEEDIPLSPPETERKAVDELRARVYLLRARSRLARVKNDKDNDLDEAQIAFDQALVKAKQLDKKVARVIESRIRVSRAKLHAWRGDVGATVADLKATLESIDPREIEDQADTYFLAARQSKEDESKILAYESAAARLNKLIRVRDVTEEARRRAQFRLGVAYLKLGNLKNSSRYYSLASNRFLDAEKAGLDTKQLHESWAQTYGLMGRVKDAAKRYRRVYELEPTAENCLRAVDSQIQSNPRSKVILELLRNGMERFPGDKDIKDRYLEVSRTIKG